MCPLACKGLGCAGRSWRILPTPILGMHTAVVFTKKTGDKLWLSFEQRPPGEPGTSVCFPSSPAAPSQEIQGETDPRRSSARGTCVWTSPAAKAAPAHIPSQNFPKLQGGGTNLGQASAWWRKLLFSIHLWGMQGQIPFTPSQRLSVSAGLHKPGHKASADTETELKRLLIAFYPPLILN